MATYKINDMPKIPRVALFVDVSRAWNRGLLRGIAKYTQLHGPWSFYRQPPYFADSHEKLMQQISKWKPDGIIMRENEKIDEIIRLNIPTIVDPYSVREIPGVANIINNSEKTGFMAAEHLLGLGLRNFAYCGFPDIYWSMERGDAFAKRIADAGFETIFYQPPKSRSQRSWANEQVYLSDWLKKLPKPIGLMTCSDERSQNVVESCKISDIHIPDQVALIGVDNDEICCELSNPPLSSINLNSEIVGYQAAELLEALMAGEKIAGNKIIIEPTHVVARQSSDVIAVDDAEVSRAIRFIRENIQEQIQVSDISRAVALSRRVLEKRFKKVLGCTVLQEIKRTRIERVIKMLIETDLPVSNIGLTLGYPGIDHIARDFRNSVGISPTEYRKKYGKPY